MEELTSLLSRVSGMSIEELEGHIQARSAAADALHAENGMLTPFLDQKWTVRLRGSRGAENLQQQVETLGNVTVGRLGN